jgi:hypothetical protein
VALTPSSFSLEKESRSTQALLLSPTTFHTATSLGVHFSMPILWVNAQCIVAHVRIPQWPHRRWLLLERHIPDMFCSCREVEIGGLTEIRDASNSVDLVSSNSRKIDTIQLSMLLPLPSQALAQYFWCFHLICGCLGITTPRCSCSRSPVGPC